MLKKVLLTKESMSFIEYELSLGGILSQAIKESSMIEGGIVSAFLPADFSKFDVLDFQESLEYITGQRVSEEQNLMLLDFICDFFEKNNDYLGIFETMWLKNDLITTERKVPYFTIGERKYDLIKKGASREIIADSIKDAQGYPTVMAFVNIAKSDHKIEYNSDYPIRYAYELAPNVTMFMIGAFDGEGYLFWEKVGHNNLI